MPLGLFLHRDGDTLTTRLEPFEEKALPPGDVLVNVRYSSLNYKDGLAVTGKGKVIRGAFPFVPGIDLSGIVEASAHTDFLPGDAVLLTGYGTGETCWGGFASLARASGEHLVHVPEGLDLFDAMALGTAGFTAMLAAMALEKAGFTDGDCVVTGASGGVGSLAVLLLSRAGRRVVASTGKAEAAAYLKSLGAAEIIGRDELGKGPQRPLESARWGGAVDTVGGPTLAAVIASLEPHASVAACGNAQSPELATTVFPFILRGVNLLGVDSNTCPMPLRREAWARLAREVPRDTLHELTTTIALADVPEYARLITEGEVRGRVVVDLGASVL
ncbi:MAG TPA: MDR family oxidoreductase [Rhodothermales bacterium]|nr:MDR family oxidoreductase [Rhodothermales bacterium]